jgi:transposase
MKTVENPLENEVAALRAMLAKYSKKIESRDEEITTLKEQLNWFLKQVFGKKSEKEVSSLGARQMEFEGFFVEEERDPSAKGSKPSPKKRRNPIRNGKDTITLPPDLPVKTIFIDVKEEEKICKETGLPLVRIGEEVTLKLAHTPGSYFIKEIIRPKYANPIKEEDGILCAEMPSTIFPKCRADDSLLADIIVRKFGDHLPLYRISEILGREGIKISRKLLSQWVMHCGSCLTPLYNEMLKRILLSGNIFVDESPINVQAKGHVIKGYMWVIVGGEGPNPPYRVYYFSENRSHKHILNILKDYKGALHSDKYGAYETLSKNNNITWNPCWAHIRRYFFEIESGDLDFRDWILKKIQNLYLLEKEGWALSPEERLKMRQEKAEPLIEEMIEKVKEKISEGSYLPKSKFSKALNYFAGLIPYLKNYIKSANSHIDNNIAERAIRPLAIGRKNWLFFGSMNAGQYSAMIFSLIQTCRGLSINPLEYIEDIFRNLMDHNSQKLDELLPDQWFLKRSEAN